MQSPLLPPVASRLAGRAGADAIAATSGDRRLTRSMPWRRRGACR